MYHNIGFDFLKTFVSRKYRFSKMSLFVCHTTSLTGTTSRLLHYLYYAICVFLWNATDNQSMARILLLLSSCDILLSSRDILLSSRDILLSSRNILLYSRDILLSSRDILLSFCDILLSSRDILFSSRDILLSSRDILLSSRGILLSSRDILLMSRDILLLSVTLFCSVHKWNRLPLPWLYPTCIDVCCRQRHACFCVVQ